jgi:hypothetical protein
MHPRPRNTVPAAVLFALAALPALGAAQVKPTIAPVRPVAAAEPKYVLEFEGGAGITSVDKMKWAGTISPLDDWNTTAYAGGARLFFTRLGTLRVGAEAGYNHFWWYTTSAAGYAITYRPHATRVGAVARAPVGARVALDGGVAAYIFPGGTNLGVNAALGYFIPAGRQWSIPVKVRGDVVFGAETTVASLLGMVGLSYRF